MTKQIKETYIYELKGKKIGVTIDYRQKQISLVEPDTLKRKNWLFAERGVKYINGWLNVLEAIESAITDAKERLEKYIEEEEEEKLKRIVVVNEAYQDENS